MSVELRCSRRWSGGLGFRLFCALLLGAVVTVSAEDTPPGRLYVVGMGPAGPDLTAPRALELVEQADYLLGSPRMPERFARFGVHIDPSKVAFDPWEGVFEREGESRDPKARAAARQAQRERVQQFALDKIHAGKTVVMMDGGDPCVYGPILGTLLAGMDDRHYEVVPGMGAVNAAAAALKRPLTGSGTRFVMLTSPRSLFGSGEEAEHDILADISKYDTTIVLYMSLRNMESLAARFLEHYPPELPVAVVYFAGYPDKERVLRSTLADIAEDVRTQDEDWLGLVIIGESIR